MEGSLNLSQKNSILQIAANIPYKMLEWYKHDCTDNIAKLVLYEVCSKSCFNFKKAAFFVNNPDFQWCRGIIGYEADGNKPVLDTESAIIDFFEKSPFHATTCSLAESSYMQNNDAYVKKIAKILHMQEPYFCTLPLKHGNDGLFIYEFFSSVNDDYKEIVQHIIALMGFCPLA